MAGRSTNTMAEFVDRQLADWGQAAGLPDADDQLIQAVQSLLVAYKRRPIEAMQQAGITNAGPSPSAMPMSSGAQPGMAMGPGSPPPAAIESIGRMMNR